MTAYNGALNNPVVIEGKLNGEYTHYVKNFNANIGIIWPEVEGTPTTTYTAELAIEPYVEGKLYGSYTPYVPPITIDYYANESIIFDSIENKTLAINYTPAPKHFDAYYDTRFNNHVIDNVEKAIYLPRQYTNKKLTGIIYPRLYKWGGNDSI